MPDFVGILSWLGDHPIVRLIGIVAAVIGCAIAVMAFLRPIIERRRKAAKQRPGVQATINRALSVDGWRSVQIHLTRPEEHDGRFDFLQSGWGIRCATLLSPRDAELADARLDDHALRGPIVARSPRVMGGRLPDHPQPFAMEFFLRFPETPMADRGKRAKFRVSIWRRQPYHAGYTLDAWAVVRDDAEIRPEN